MASTTERARWISSPAKSTKPSVGSPAPSRTILVTFSVTTGTSTALRWRPSAAANSSPVVSPKPAKLAIRCGPEMWLKGVWPASSTTLRPRFFTLIAAEAPAGPAPTTATSYRGGMVVSFISSTPGVEVCADDSPAARV